MKQSGQLIREAYQRRLPSNPAKDYYFIQRDTGKTQSIIVEYGFLDTILDANRLKTNYKSYAEAVVKSVVEYLDLSYDKEDEKNIYTVQKGDSLWSIAKKINVTVETLKTINNLSSNLLNIGQKLVIPNKEEIPEIGDYKIYVVQKGDNLYAIARKYNITIDELIAYNNLATINLQVGNQILIPIVNKESVIENYIKHIVQKEDNLYALAIKYGVTVNDIKSLNKLNNNLLKIGQIILIPSKTIVPSEMYTVKSGDNLYKIASKYNTTVDSIKNKNNLDSNLLNIGQVLII